MLVTEYAAPPSVLWFSRAWVVCAKLNLYDDVTLKRCWAARYLPGGDLFQVSFMPPCSMRCMHPLVTIFRSVRHTSMHAYL